MNDLHMCSSMTAAGLMNTQEDGDDHILTNITFQNNHTMYRKLTIYGHIIYIYMEPKPILNAHREGLFFKRHFLLYGGLIYFPQFWNLLPVTSELAVMSIYYTLKEKRNMTGGQIVKTLPHRHIADFYTRKNALQFYLKHFCHAVFFVCTFSTWFSFFHTCKHLLQKTFPFDSSAI